MQVPLSINMLNEAKLEEMIGILESLHKYVPTKSTSMTLQSCNQDDLPVEFEDTSSFLVEIK